VRIKTVTAAVERRVVETAVNAKSRVKIYYKR